MSGLSSDQVTVTLAMCGAMAMRFLISEAVRIWRLRHDHSGALRD